MTRIRIVVISIILLSRCVDVDGKERLLRRTREAKDDCNENLTVSGNGGTITSVGYPEKYPSNTDCRWLLSASDPNVSLFLRIDTLQIEPDTNCKLDYLQVYLGSTALAPALGPFCGTIKDKVLKTNSSTLLVVFHSDPIYEDKGFSLDYFTHNAGDCKTALKDDTGVLRSPGFPGNYPDSADCWTLITVDPSKKLILEFDSLDLEYGENCTFDYVRVYDGATRESPVLGQVCIRQDISAAAFQSTENSLLLHFHSDDSVNRKGYRAHYSTIDRSTSMFGDCLWDSGENNGTAASPNYPSNYPGLSNCSIWLQAPEDQRIQIVFDALQLEIEKNCSYDYLQIIDGSPPNSKLIGTYCGRGMEPKNLTSATNEVNLVFISDDFAEFSGFKLHYHFIKNETKAVDDARIDGSMKSDVSFDVVPQNATLAVGSSHMLRCSTKHPLAKIRWLKDEHFLAGGNPLPGLKVLSNNSIWIHSMDTRLAGQYTCVAVTSEKTISANAYVLAKDGSKNDSECGIVFRKVPRDISYAEGEFAHLECLASGTNIKLTWEKDGQELVSSKRITLLNNGFLFVDKVMQEDAGIYSCVAYDQLAECRKKASAFLQVSRRTNIEEVCGKPSIGSPDTTAPRIDHGKIVGGHNTKKGAYPWQVMLWEPNLLSYCGGSLLNERWIATAAHCFRNYQNMRWDRVVIKLGKYDREMEERQEFRTGIADPSSIVVHPAYNKDTFDNDLALVRMRDHVTFSEYILPVCLPDRPGLLSPENMQMGTVTGWGQLKDHGPSPRFLQEIRLPVVDQKKCMASTNFTVSRNMFCAGYAQEIVGDACRGDSGGPFLMNSDDKWYVIGIVSWGEGCGKANKYGFYTRINNYLPWIKGIIKS